MKQKFFKYTEWEDFLNGMYDDVEDHDSKIKECINFMVNENDFEFAMKRVINEWPVATEQNLTNTSKNRVAWIGQAACCIEIGCPEYITRKAWSILDEKKRNIANKKAESVIKKWESVYETENYQLHFFMGTKMLPRWNTRRGQLKA